VPIDMREALSAAPQPMLRSEFGWIWLMNSDARSAATKKCGSGTGSGLPCGSLIGCVCAVTRTTQASQHGCVTLLPEALASACA
jgi:hypothetical protein